MNQTEIKSLHVIIDKRKLKCRNKCVLYKCIVSTPTKPLQIYTGISEDEWKNGIIITQNHSKANIKMNYHLVVTFGTLRRRLNKFYTYKIRKSYFLFKFVFWGFNTSSIFWIKTLFLRKVVLAKLILLNNIL